MYRFAIRIGYWQVMFLLSSWLFGINSHQVFSTESNLNILPMYGQQPKSAYQFEADQTFIENAVRILGTKEAASVYTATKAWQFYYKDDLDTAMKRFNQAWLLNPNNYNCYWGFGIIEGRHHHLANALEFLKKAIALHPTQNATLMSDLAYTQTLWALDQPLTKSPFLLKEAENVLQSAHQLEPNNGQILFIMSLNLYYQKCYTQSLKYYKKSYKLLSHHRDKRLYNELKVKCQANTVD